MVGYWKNETRENIFEKGSRVVVAERTIPLSFYFFAVILPEYCFIYFSCRVVVVVAVVVRWLLRCTMENHQ